MIRFDGRVAIVTGAGGGLGRSYALDLAKRGAAVVVNDIGCGPNGIGSSPDVADKVVEEIRSAGGQAVPSYDTMATWSGGEAIVNSAMKSFGRVDIVISNAGFVRNSPFGEIKEEDLDALIAIHLKGGFHVGQPAFRIMKQQGYGRFVFTASSTAAFSGENQSAYASAKAGLMGLSNNVAAEGKAFGILSNIILPMAHTRLAGDVNKERAEKMAPLTKLLGQTTEPQFVAPLVAYLCSEQCTLTQGIYSALGGCYSSGFLGITAGWMGPRDEPASAEEIMDHLEQIEERSGYTVPRNVQEQIAPVAEMVRRSLAWPSRTS